VVTVIRHVVQELQRVGIQDKVNGAELANGKKLKCKPKTIIRIQTSHSEAVGQK
jgi:hypothetical protein